jgi:hypothetical protein
MAAVAPPAQWKAMPGGYTDRGTGHDAGLGRNARSCVVASWWLAHPHERATPHVSHFLDTCSEFDKAPPTVLQVHTHMPQRTSHRDAVCGITIQLVERQELEGQVKCVQMNTKLLNWTHVVTENCQKDRLEKRRWRRPIRKMWYASREVVLNSVETICPILMFNLEK